MNRRTFGLGTIAAASLALAEMRGTAAAAKVSLCKPCTGHGNCQSGYCQGGLCMPTNDECGGHKRTFRCRSGEPCCCRRGHGCRRI